MGKFKEKLAEGKEFVITCEFVPGRGPKGGSIEGATDFGKQVVEKGLPVDAISITDNPGGNPAISPDALGMELKRIGIEALIHFACSDGNRNMLESRAWGLARDGIDNVLVVTGDYQTSGFRGVSKPVFDLDSVQMVKYFSEMNKGLKVPGRKKGTKDTLKKTDFCIGAVVSPFKRLESELMTQYFKLEKKVAAGANFIIPQLGYDVRKFAEVKKYMMYRGLDVPIIGNVYVITKMVAGVMNRDLIPGCVVTDALAKKISAEAKSDDKGKKAIFRGMGFNGVHIGGFALKYEDYEYIIRRSEEIADDWRDFIPNFRYNQKGEFFLFPDDPDLSFAEDRLKPAALSKPKVPATYDCMKIVHNFVFEEGALGYGLTKEFYEWVKDKKYVSRFCHLLEKLDKVVLFDCQDCGDCSLLDLAYLCPMSQCAKYQRNGPCGGSSNGKCEADKEKPCVWTRVYERLAATGGLDYIRKEFIPPPNAELAGTSAWANFFLGKDHTAKRLARAKKKAAKKAEGVPKPEKSAPAAEGA